MQRRSAGHDPLAGNTAVRDNLRKMTQQPSRGAAEAMRASGPAPGAPHGTKRQAVLPLVDPRPDRPAVEPVGPDFWHGRVRQALADRSSQAVEFADEGLRAWPADPELLLLAALTALAVRQPERALALLKRYGKRYRPGKPVSLLTALALGQQGHFARAWAMLQAEQLDSERAALGWFVGDDVMQEWLFASLRDIRLQRLRSPAPPRAAGSPAPARPPKPAAARPPITRTNARPPAQIAAPPPAVADLPRLEARFEMTFELANADAIEIVGAEASPEPGPFRLRGGTRPAQPVRRVRRTALPAGAAGRGGALVSGRDGPQGAEAVSRPGPARRRGRARQDRRGGDGAEGIHPARHGRAHPDPHPGLAGRTVARRDGEQVRHRLRHQPRPAAAQRPRALLGAAARDRLDRRGAPQGAGRPARGI